MGRVKDTFVTDEPPQEGARCPIDDCHGRLVLQPVEDCACHISPPCKACIERQLECDSCHEVFEQ